MWDSWNEQRRHWDAFSIESALAEFERGLERLSRLRERMLHLTDELVFCRLSDIGADL